MIYELDFRKRGSKYFLGPPQWRVDGRPVDPLSLRFRNPCFLIHGFRASDETTNLVYLIIENRLYSRYSEFIRVHWPSGWIPTILGWKWACRQARKVAQAMQSEITRLAPVFHNGLSFEAHSLGARIAGEVATELSRYVRHLVLAAPAVSSRVFALGADWGVLGFNGVEGQIRTLVAWSKNDSVLSKFYRAVEGDEALGLVGPPDHLFARGDLLTRRMISLDCSDEVYGLSGHGGYYQLDKFLDSWKEM